MKDNDPWLNEGGPAFPVRAGDNDSAAIYKGMSLRDWFAGQALAGLCVSEGFLFTPEQNKRQAEWAYAIADQMLSVRRATNP